MAETGGIRQESGCDQLGYEDALLQSGPAAAIASDAP